MSEIKEIMEVKEIIEKYKNSKSERIRNAFELLDIALRMEPEDQRLSTGIAIGIDASRDFMERKGA